MKSNAERPLRRQLRVFAACTLSLVTSILVGLSPVSASEEPFRPFPLDLSAIEGAIARERPSRPPEVRLTGITVPHHLLAADLIARGFWAASATRPARIVVLHPDHFKRLRGPFATTTRGFVTTFGRVETDRDATAVLLARPDVFERSVLFEREHGLQALLPFIARFFPGVPIIPVAISIQSRREEWEAAFPSLLSLVTDDTLIIQSTDFSHFLPPHKARQRDQETLNVLSAGSIEALVRLRQPLHLDSLASQYLQMRLQKARFDAAPVVIANGSAQDYFQSPVLDTTTYIVQLFCRPARSGPPCGWREPATVVFAGDTLFGRNFGPLLQNDTVASGLSREIRLQTGGAPLIVNLEGVVADEIPAGAGRMTMVMPVRTTLQWLGELNVVAVSLANNHAMDLGREPYDEMVQTLTRAGLIVLSHGETKPVGRLLVTALTDLSNTQWPRIDRIGQDEIAKLALDAGSSPAMPIVAFVHWGEEGNPTARQREREIAEELRQQSIVAVVGSHPHVASTAITLVGEGEMQTTHSLGNFLFDQLGPNTSGALLEVRVFPQGTMFTRLVRIPNLFQLAIELSRQ